MTIWKLLTKGMLLTQKNFISEKTFLQVSKMLTLIISYSNIVYLVSNFPSFLDLLCYRGNSVFFTFPTILSRKLILSTFAPSLENTTESNQTGKLIFFIRGGIIVERIIFYQFNQYVCFYHDIAWKSSWKRLIYIQCFLGLSPHVLSPTSPIAEILVSQFPPLKILRYTVKLSYRHPPQVFKHKSRKTI